jgi:hypothetical protein
LFEIICDLYAFSMSSSQQDGPAHLRSQSLRRKYPCGMWDPIGLQQILAHGPRVELQKQPWRASGQILPVRVLKRRKVSYRVLELLQVRVRPRDRVFVRGLAEDIEGAQQSREITHAGHRASRQERGSKERG